MGQGIIKMYDEFFLTAFAFPEGTKLISIEVDHFTSPTATVKIIVEHDDLPEIKPCPVLMPSFTYKTTDAPREWITFDWGIDE
jgi:hypothetical protein